MANKEEVVELEAKVEKNTEEETKNEQLVEETNKNETSEAKENIVQKEEVENSEEENLSVEKAILERFGNIGETVEEIIELAKEGYENKKSVIEKAIESGIHSMGNAFNKDVFEKTFLKMSTKDIEKMGKTWEEQAQNMFVKEKVSKQDLDDKNEQEENFKRIGLTQFKTANY